MKYIIDLDGTILNGLEPNMDSVEFIKSLQSNGCEFLIMTNSIKSPKVVVDRLESVGLNITTDDVMNPISTINAFITENGYEDVLTIGSITEIEQVLANQNHVNPELIVLLDFEKDNIAYSVIQEILNHLEAGVPIISASGSPFYMSGGSKKVDTGAFVKLFESITNQTIEIFGKPSSRYFMAGVKKLGATPSEVTVIGDDHNTDIKGANEIGCRSILVQSGKYKSGDELKNKPTQCIKAFKEVQV